jgi:hypothetical protein
MGLALRKIATGTVALALAGCSGSPVVSIDDSGKSSPPDSTTSLDAGPDATADAGPDVASTDAVTTMATGEDAAAPDADAGLGAAADASAESSRDGQAQSDATSLDALSQTDVLIQAKVDSGDATLEAGEVDGSSVDEASIEAGGPTEDLLQGRSAACLTCGTPCIDPNQDGLTCDGFSGAQLTTCLQVLGCALGANCGTTPSSPSCLCGAADASACAATASPTGPCGEYYLAAFDGGSIQDILSEFGDFTSPAGMANQIVSCLQTPVVGCPACF